MNKRQISELEKWLDGDFEHLNPEYFYGDQSYFSLNFSELISQSRSNKWFDRFHEENLKILQPKLTNPSHLADGFKYLNHALSDSKNELDGSTDLRKANEAFSSYFKSGIQPFSSYVEFNAAAGAPRPAKGEKQQMRLFTDAFEELSNQPGYWMALDIAELGNRSDSPHSSKLRLLYAAREAESPEWRKSVVPTVFWSTGDSNENEKDNGKGYVLWLTIELIDDFPGPFVPFLPAFGFTDITQLIEPMSQVWNASGLANTYRGRWSLTCRYPGNDSDFVAYRPSLFLPELGGSSLQAAALAACWAATGQIPQKDGPPFELNGKPLNLNPRVGITAAIDLSGDLSKTNTTRLKAIEEESIVGKADALSSYSVGHKPENTLFDSFIAVGDDAAKVREKFTTEQERSSDYHGLRIIENCQTMADALDWMLEVNAWKKAWNEHVEQKWLEQWGYARDADGFFLKKDADSHDGDAKKILFAKPAQGEDGQWHDEWDVWLNADDRRFIMLDDDTQKVTLEPKDKDNKDTMQQQLDAGLREYLESIVMQQGINTGSIEYMKRPVGGANNDDMPDPTEDQDVNKVDLRD